MRVKALQCVPSTPLAVRPVLARGHRFKDLVDAFIKVAKEYPIGSHLLKFAFNRRQCRCAHNVVKTLFAVVLRSACVCSFFFFIWHLQIHSLSFRFNGISLAL